MKTKKFTATVTNCSGCPNVRTRHTPGSGFGVDYFCAAAGDKKTGYKKIKGYVEWPREAPQDGEFPSFCPLPDDET